ncbi:predicted protein [Micromonas commoda]|uniref:tRNA (guanine(46)-N(7))-methyltransferase n=1 Tax=Micromonas commoda (strain RCC299 / NOUM17 / CCMP2709) TaxID=296587 RepID=C1EC50_MICCC|nr:predicted protein [Micromonas commoda]ACO65525.1 predicted protein [Micromonas commoda]|eukprot:XP_002504267.1 predicted protein [Micromonas commoda]
MKKMTNPMAAPHRVPVEAPDWPTVFKDPTLPTFIDVGCAKGRFLQRAATVDREVFEAAHGRHNLLGLEIYPPIVEDANLWTRTHDGAGAIGNLHFVACNANVSLAGMRVPNVRMVSVLFPDPWSRRKHAGRRVVTAQFVNTLASALVEGARVYCCSDVRPLAAEMQALWLAANPMGVPTERDLVCESKWRPVYRFVVRRL